MTRRSPPEAAAAGFLAALVLMVFAPVWVRGLSPFWSDLTYLHHPWKTAGIQLLQSGRLPLWNPYIYLGMPMAGSMQDEVFYPGSLPFMFWGFATALAVFQAFHHWLAGLLTCFWLRTLRLSWGASLAGALLICLGGVFMSHMPFLNHIAVLSLAPGLFLFFRRPPLLALTLAVAFLAGYPPFLIGSAAGAWALSLVLGRGRRDAAAGWVVAGALAAAFAACLLLPAAELFAHSRRTGGIELAEALNFGFAPRDLVQWISPLLVPWKAFDPAVEWWKGCYAGILGCLAAAWGAARLPRRKALGLAALAVALLVMILGGSNPLSAAVWAHFPPLRFIRYPGNTTYLALPCLALLAAAGFERLRRRGLLLLLLALELSAYAWKAYPAAPRSLFTEAGPLARFLQGSLGDDRYLSSPLALEQQGGRGIRDWKYRLYGLTNIPFRLRAAGNFGEPLVPRECYEFMDSIYRRPGAESAAALFPWAGIRFLLTPAPVPASRRLIPQGKTLWEVSRYPGPLAGAYGFDSPSGDKIPALLPVPGEEPAIGRPLAVSRPREDRFTVAGDLGGPGWAYVAEPRYPGWTAALTTPAGVAAAETFPAMTAFQKVKVPAGPWRLDFRYDPWSWRLGRLVTALSLLGFAGYWYNRALRAKA